MKTTRIYATSLRLRPLLAVGFVLLATVCPARAHPLGNDSINHIDILWVLPDRLEFDLFLDFAEGPSAPFTKEIDRNDDGRESSDEQWAWIEKKAAEFTPFLKAAIDGQPLALEPVEQAFDPVTGKKTKGIPGLLKIPGVVGMPTYKLLIRYVGKYPQALAAGEHVLEFENATYPQYMGLRRIILEKVPAVEVIPPHPAFFDPDSSAFFYDQYDPANLPQERRATVKFRLAQAATAPAAGPDASADSAMAGSTQTTAPAGSVNGLPSEQPPAYLASITDPRNDPAQQGSSNQQAQQLVGLLQGSWGVWMFLTVTALAFTWGAAHALMPGHAKTVVAAYLISQKGTYWHAVMLAVIVTVTHTALVVIVGVIIWAYQASHPTLGARLQLYLGIVAGLLVAGMGLVLIWRALTGRIAHHHEHEHDHTHDDRSWLRKLFTHSHPHLPGESHTHGHHHGHDHPPHHHDHHHDHAHTHAHGHDHVHEHEHDHHHDHHHGHAHDHSHTHTHTHDHEHGHVHGHSPAQVHAHSPAAVSAAPAATTAGYASRSREVESGDRLTFRTLLLLGVTGGIVPCPTATIILLLGIGANVVLGALYAVGIFSLGLALTLMVIGFLALSSRRFAARVLSDARHEGELSTRGQKLLLQALPAVSGAVVFALGAAISANYVYYLLNGTALVRWLG